LDVLILLYNVLDERSKENKKTHLLGTSNISNNPSPKVPWYKIRSFSYANLIQTNEAVKIVIKKEVRKLICRELEHVKYWGFKFAQR